MASTYISSRDSVGAVSGSSAAVLSICAILSVGWLLSVWMFAIPDVRLALDFAAWRQADTQAIARHFVEPHASIFYPRIDWGGDGPGYVEAELQVYTLLLSWFLRIFGDVEWPGRVLSSLAAVCAACILFVHFERKLGRLPALVGSMLFLSAPGIVLMGTLVQPDMLALLAFVIAWVALERYAERGEQNALLTYGLAGALALLIKPTMVQIGVASFVFLFSSARARLRNKTLWITWAVMLALLLANYLHGREIYESYGNSFGVLSGNDAKLPKLRHLAMPQLWLQAVLSSRRWGAGTLGTIALLLAVIFRRGQAATWSLFAGNAIWTIATLRYSTSSGGTNYVVGSAVVGAYAAAQLAAALLEYRPRTQLLATAAIALVCALSFQRAMTLRAWWGNEDPSAPRVAAVSELLAQHTKPGDLVVVRSDHEQHDDFWDTTNNVSDPRVFSLTKTRGWGVGVDDPRVDTLASYRARGAKFYVDPFGVRQPDAVRAWLSREGRLVGRTRFGGEVLALSEPDPQ